MIMPQSLAPFSAVGIAGGRRLSPAFATAVVSTAVASSIPLFCTDASGPSAVAAPVASRVFSAEHHTPAGLASRAAAFVRHLAATGPAPLLVCWPGRPAPAGLLPSRSWISCGSGSWSELSLARGLGCGAAVYLDFSALPGVRHAPPARWGGWRLVPTGPLAGSYYLPPLARLF